jgi:type I restriction enzyme, S subunit
VNFFTGPIFVSDAFTVKPELEKANARYLFHVLKNKQEEIYTLQTGG